MLSSKLADSSAPEADISPFEFKDTLLKIASSHADRMMLNAGRGNPNFLAIAPRRAFLQLGDFALQEASRSYAYLHSGFGGLPESGGMLQRFETWMHHHEDEQGMRFLQASLALVKDQLGVDIERFVREMVNAFLGCHYPEPVTVLSEFEPVIKAYLGKELNGGGYSLEGFRLFATEGGTAAMSYLFQSLRANYLLQPGDSIALGTPIFTPYLEIPELAEYQLNIVEIDADEGRGWQLSDKAIEVLVNPAIKLFCLVNPSNPPSVNISQSTMAKLVRLIKEQRPDLMVITDDVYATFADDFSSLFMRCPYNTLCVYSFSKYFGATGWRLGVIALHDQNVFDERLKQCSIDQLNRLDRRYGTITQHPSDLSFIERLVADSRNVALHHSAGLSTPQQLQMVLFCLACLIDQEDAYKTEAKRLVRSRYVTLYRHIGINVPEISDCVGYYTIIDLEQLARALYGEAFGHWLLSRYSCQDFLLRLAEETGIVLLPARGFEVHHPAVRVSLANLTLANYAAIGRLTRQVVDEFYNEFKGL